MSVNHLGHLFSKFSSKTLNLIAIISMRLYLEAGPQ